MTEALSRLPEAIYEAAFVPERWSGLLTEVAESSNAASGSILLFPGPGIPPRFRAAPFTEEELGRHVTTDAWRSSRTAEATFRNLRHPNFLGFSYVRDLMTPEEVAEDSVIGSLNRLGLDAQIGTIIPMITGEIVVFTFERWLEHGRFTKGETAILNSLRAHLARAGLIAARLGLEQARGMVAGIEALGLPAAVLAGRRVLAANTLFEQEATTFRIGAGNRLSLANVAADTLVQAALCSGPGAVAVRSVPLPATERRPALVVHVLPLSRAAHDIFSGDALIAVTAVDVQAGVPHPTILTGLFDLSPAEARLAVSLASGLSIKESATAAAIQVSTARSYLESIFRKTGAHQQSELVSLLKSTAVIRPGRT